jgi:hypothetical protein
MSFVATRVRLLITSDPIINKFLGSNTFDSEYAVKRKFNEPPGLTALEVVVYKTVNDVWRYVRHAKTPRLPSKLIRWSATATHVRMSAASSGRWANLGGLDELAKGPPFGDLANLLFFGSCTGYISVE